MKKTLSIVSIVFLAVLLQGCLYTKSEIDVKPVEIKPMHITIDVNVKVEKQLDDFFGDLDKKAEKISTQEKSPKTQTLPQVQTQNTTDTNKL